MIKFQNLTLVVTVGNFTSCEEIYANDAASVSEFSISSLTVQ